MTDRDLQLATREAHGGQNIAIARRARGEPPCRQRCPAACSSGGTMNYPHGGDPQDGFQAGYEPTSCNGPEVLPNSLVEVATMPACQSQAIGYVGIFDMSGNAWEWQDECRTNPTQPPIDDCGVRGGSYDSEHTYHMTCHYYGAHEARNHDKGESIGFRCCSDP